MAKKKLSRKQQLAVPRLRAKLPDSALPPDLLAKRKKNQRLNAPFVEGSSLTNRDVAHQRDAAVKLQYGQQDQQLRTTGRQINAWFPQYQQELTRLNNEQQARYTAAQKAIVDNAAAAQTQQAGSNQALQSSMQADAAKRGATYSGDPTAQSQQASNIGQNLADAFSAAIAAQGTAYSGYTSDQGKQAAAAQLSARQGLAASKQTLAQQKGAYAQNYVDTARSNEQKNVLEQAAFGLKQQTEADTVAAKRAARKVSRKNTRDHIASSEKQTTDRINAAAQAKKDAAAQKQKDHVQKVREGSKKELSRVHDALGRWNTYASTKVTDNATKKSRPPTPDEIRQRLFKEGFSAPEVHLALMLRAHKPFSPSDLALAHELGIRVPREYLRPAKPKKVNVVAGVTVPTSVQHPGSFKAPKTSN